MDKAKATQLSKQGIKFLNDPVMYDALSVISNSLGSTPGEYLLRFEKVLNDNPEAIMGIFEVDCCVFKKGCLK